MPCSQGSFFRSYDQDTYDPFELTMPCSQGRFFSENTTFGTNALQGDPVTMPTALQNIQPALQQARGPEDMVFRAISGEIVGVAQMQVATAIFVGRMDLLMGCYSEISENGSVNQASLVDLTMRFGYNDSAKALALLGVPRLGAHAFTATTFLRQERVKAEKASVLAVFPEVVPPPPARFKPPAPPAPNVLKQASERFSLCADPVPKSSAQIQRADKKRRSVSCPARITQVFAGNFPCLCEAWNQPAAGRTVCKFASRGSCRHAEGPSLEAHGCSRCHSARCANLYLRFQDGIYRYKNRKQEAYRERMHSNQSSRSKGTRSRLPRLPPWRPSGKHYRDRNAGNE